MSHPTITNRSPNSPPYKRHRPEQTLLYQIIEQYYPEFRDVMAMQGRSLPLHVQQEFAGGEKTTAVIELPIQFKL